ncbi:MAG: methyl-accepting chemotaxis protein [Asticcacaulis sp.]|uniref:methyl-accepting chemotaxis protein n=1 Tax=Asticcacaulis sp. TaxID=1872648 RepID=UPI003F7C7C9A
MNIFKEDHDRLVVESLGRSSAVIEFTPQGQILTTNENFLSAMGYRLEEIKGRPHAIFCGVDYARSVDYSAFWQDLRAGKFRSAEFKRLRKDGTTIWLQASYNPVINRAGRVISIIKFATDITDLKKISLDDAGKLAAISLSQAVIEFTPQGRILTANDNFLKTVGYELREIEGKEHKIFCEPDFVASSAYGELWSKLRAGEFVAGEFRRLSKGGTIVHIQAAYNPIFDDEGKVVKVVKFAVDVTALVEKRLRNEKMALGVNDDLAGVLEQIKAADVLAGGATAASSETQSIINSVAAASEELSQSVRQIAHSMDLARSRVEGVSLSAEKANSSADELRTSASAMTGIVALIQDIAAQINLLSLNATIESARAGEAGRGFAVVASEVKTLANQVSQSTKTIAAEIDRMQSVSETVVSEMEQISVTMSEVLKNVSEVSQAMNQQSDVTGEISQNMQAAVGAVTQISSGLVDISHTFSEVARASTDVKLAVETLVA